MRVFVYTCNTHTLFCCSNYQKIDVQKMTSAKETQRQKYYTFDISRESAIYFFILNTFLSITITSFDLIQRYRIFHFVTS